MEYITLNNGIKIPQMGLGLRCLSDPDICEQVVLAGFTAGYRMLDGSQTFHNEAFIGNAIAACGLPRDELFVTTKLSPLHYHKDPRRYIERSVKRLCSSYLDMFYLSHMFGDWKSGYKALEWAYEQKLCRSIGICNCLSITQLKELESFANIPPMINQLECHPYMQQGTIKTYMDEHKIQLAAWYPLGNARRMLLENPVILKISKTHRRTPAQIILRWHLQCGHIFAPGTKNPEHMRSNLRCLDITLSSEEMEELNALDLGRSFIRKSHQMKNILYRGFS